MHAVSCPGSRHSAWLVCLFYTNCACGVISAIRLVSRLHCNVYNVLNSFFRIFAPVLFVVCGWSDGASRAGAPFSAAATRTAATAGAVFCSHVNNRPVWSTDAANGEQGQGVNILVLSVNIDKAFVLQSRVYILDYLRTVIFHMFRMRLRRHGRHSVRCLCRRGNSCQGWLLAVKRLQPICSSVSLLNSCRIGQGRLLLMVWTAIHLSFLWLVLVVTWFE